MHTKWMSGWMDGWMKDGEERHHTDLPIKTSPKMFFFSRDTDSLRIIYLFQHHKNPGRFAPAEYLYLINTITIGSQFSINFFGKKGQSFLTNHLPC